VPATRRFTAVAIWHAQRSIRLGEILDPTAMPAIRLADSSELVGGKSIQDQEELKCFDESNSAFLP
jgi:hypothetical protein